MKSTNFLAGGGEMGALMRDFAWEESPLRSPHTWPQSLRVTIRLMLNTNHPMFIWWGSELIHLAKEALRDSTTRLERLFDQAPSFIAVLRGAGHVFEFANAAYRRLVGNRDVIGKPVQVALRELEEQGFFKLLDDVFHTGKAHVGRRVPVKLHSAGDEEMKELFLDFIYQPIVESNGLISGVFVEGADVTDHMRAEEHLRMLNNELKHRVKNTLTMVSAIAGQTLSGTRQDDALRSFQGRLAAFAKAHDLLTAETWATASLHDVVHGALAPYHPTGERFAITGPPITVGSKQALALALSLYELATNAIKYGALSNQTGTVDIAWNLETEGAAPVFQFVWREEGGPAVDEPSRFGFGSRLIKRVLEADLGGTIDHGFAPGGVTMSLTALAQNLRSPAPPLSLLPA